MDNDNFNAFKVRASQVTGLNKLIVKKAEIETLVANAVTAAEAKIEKLIVKKAEIETLITNAVVAAEAKIEKLIVKKAEIETLIVKALEAFSISLPVETSKLAHNTVKWLLAEVEKGFITVIEAANKRNVILEIGALAEKVNAGLTIRARNKGLGPGEEALRAAVRSSLEGIVLDIMGEGGSSAFLQLATHLNQDTQTLLKAKVYFGTVNAAGGIVAGSGFTVVHPSTGIYGIAFNEELANPCVCVATPAEPADTRVQGGAKTGFEVQTVNYAGTIFQNSAFTFIAIG